MAATMRRRDFALMAGPSLVVMAALLAAPLFYTLIWSFQNVTYGSAGQWVGLKNYTTALGDPTFRAAAAFSIAFAVIKTALVICLGYGLALLLNRARRSRPAFLGLLLVPYVIPAVVGATAFSWLFDNNFGGLVNYFLSKVGVHQIFWFTDTWPNRSLVLMDVLWNEAPFVMLVLLGALQGVSREVIEAATVDGAGWWARQRRIIIPWMYPMMRFIALISLMDGLRLFDPLIPLAPSAQNSGTESISLYVYQQAFSRGQQNLGLGSAVNVMLVIILIPLVAPFLRQVYRDVVSR